MSENAIWSAIENDAPREWSVIADGQPYGTVVADGASVFEAVETELLQDRIDYFDYGTRVHRIEVRCAATQERLRETRTVRVDKDSGVSRLM